MSLEKKICIFLTSRFPFGKTESFVENEIPFMSKSFEKIYIISLDSGKGFRREIPNNFDVFSLKIWGGFFTKILRFFTGFFVYINNCVFEGKGFGSKMQYFYDKGTSFIIYRRIKRIIKNMNIDLNQVVFYSYWLDNNAAAISIFKNKVDKKHSALYVCRAHGSDLYSERTSFNFLPLQSYCIMSLDFIFPISKDGLNYLTNKYPNFLKKFHQHYLGTIDHGLQKQSISNEVVFLTCSNIIPLKRLDVFAKAFCELSKEYKIKWICIGSGEDENKLKAIISENDCSNIVIFKGRMSNSEVIDFYQSNKVDFFVNVSEYEGLPVSIMEAFSFGIPVVATNVGGVKEIVNGSNGFLINDLSILSLLNTLRVCCSLGQDEYFQKRKSARKTWELYYNAIANYSKFYKYLLNIEVY